MSVCFFMSDDLVSVNCKWEKDIDPDLWDMCLAKLGGHPLQSALWGDARRTVENIIDHRWICFQKDQPCCMIRVEERKLPFFGVVGWIPRGPTGKGELIFDKNFEPVVSELKSRNFRLLISDPWQKKEINKNTSGLNRKAPLTIWIDLSQGQQKLWEKFH